MSRRDQDVEKLFEELLEKNLSDGYPVIPPTKERVKRMLEFTDRKPDDVIGKVPPSMDEATVELIAVNAVMAGCRSEYFPIVLTAMKSVLASPNLRGGICTTGRTYPITVVNGPMAREIGMNSSWAFLGPAPQNRPNMSIGRTITLCIQNIGNELPGITSKKPYGTLSRYGICIAENEDASPWEPLHVEKGFDRETSTVTAIGDIGEPGRVGGGDGAMFSRSEYNAETVKSELMSLASGLGGRTPHNQLRKDNDSFLLVSPGIACYWNDFGWTKKDLKMFLYKNAHFAPMSEWYANLPPELRERGIKTALTDTPKWWAELAEIGPPAIESPDRLWIVVVGPNDFRGVSIARGGHGDTPGIINPVTFADGTPAKSVYDFKRKRKPK